MQITGDKSQDLVFAAVDKPFDLVVLGKVRSKGYFKGLFINLFLKLINVRAYMPVLEDRINLGWS